MSMPQTDRPVVVLESWLYEIREDYRRNTEIVRDLTKQLQDSKKTKYLSRADLQIRWGMSENSVKKYLTAYCKQLRIKPMLIGANPRYKETDIERIEQFSTPKK